jgi:hypothetical protein
MHGKKMMHATMLLCKYAKTMRRICFGAVKRTKRGGELMQEA